MIDPAGDDPVPAAETVEVSVLVPVLNEKRQIRATLAAMCAQCFDGSVELLLIDGGSDDGTVAILEEAAREDDRLRVLRNPARRTPQALNVGLRHARGEFIVRMDAHTFYPPDYVASGVARMRAGGAAWVSGPALPRGESPGSRRVEFALRSWLGVGGAAFRRDAGREVEVDTGFAGVMRRETLEALGGWDEGWPINQDAELAARVRSGGGRIVCIPEMAAGYVPRDSIGGLARQYWRYGRYRAKTSGRHPDSMRPTHLLAPGLSLTLLMAVLGPVRARRAARAALGPYAVAVLVASSRSGGRWLDAVLLPTVFATMHVAWGFGFLAGSVRFGPPVAGVVRAVRAAAGLGQQAATSRRRRRQPSAGGESF